MNNKLNRDQNLRIIFMSAFILAGFIISRFGHPGWGSVCKIIGMLHFKINMLSPEMVEKMKIKLMSIGKLLMYLGLSIVVMGAVGDIFHNGSIILTPKVGFSVSFIILLSLAEIAILKSKRIKAVAQIKK